MIFYIRNIIIYTFTPLFFVLSLYLIFKTKKDYHILQKRTKCTSALCLIFHELYVGLACYSAWYNTWPFLSLNSVLYLHYILLIVGLFPTFFGITFYVFYLAGMKSFQRAVGLSSDELITEGIFKVSRNPQSLGRGVGLIGIGIMGRSFFTLLLAIIWIIINHFYILIEEEYLEDKFGDSYLKYCSLTPRYYNLHRKR